MSFVDSTFVMFFLAVFALYWALGASRRAQNALLLVASFVFYGWVHPWMMGLLFGSAMLNFICGMKIGDERAAGGTGNGWLWVSLVGNLGTLGFFKYFHFFEAQTVTALQAMGFDAHLTTLQIFLPLGLSFYTFHAMAYTIDIWRDQFPARRDPIDFLLFIAFFPQLVAGPIARAHQLLVQVEEPRTFKADQVMSGLSLTLFGAFKKVVIADTMAPYVNIVYASEDPSWGMIWAAALGFTIQVLADFTGYTDMARGCARMLGIELVENFNHPYMAASPSDFWNRWHMSFSTWLRDYVYMPASFSPWVRRWITIPGTGEWSPFWHTTRSLTITMLISGIWHGSTWNYVLWGLYYAVIGTVWTAAQQRIPRKVRKQRDWRPVLVPLMFLHTLVGMMIFREPDVGRLVTHFLRNPFAATEDQWIVTGGLLMICAYGAVPLVLAMLWEFYVTPRLKDSPWQLPVRTTGWAIAAVLLITFFRPTGNDFVYFQF